jgi:hypothetical protein
MRRRCVALQRRHATDDVHGKPCDWERASCIVQRDDVPEWDRHGQETRSNRERAFCNIQQTTRNAEHVPDEMRTWDLATDRQRTPRDMGHLGGQHENRPQTTRSRPDPTDSNAADDTQGRACNTTGNCATDATPHATRNRQNATDDTQRATENDRQHAPCSGRHATRNKQRATCNMRQTSSNMQRATTTCNATDNMHRTPGNVRMQQKPDFV